MNFRLFLEFSDIQALLSAALDRPDDDTPKLVAADWCDDHGMTVTAATIRAAIEIGRSGEYLPNWRRKEDEAEEEFRSHGVTFNLTSNLIHHWEDGVTNYTVTPKGISIQRQRDRPDRRTRTYSIPDVVAVAVVYLLSRLQYQAGAYAIPVPTQNLQQTLRDVQLHALQYSRTLAGNDAIRFLNTAKNFEAAVRRWVQVGKHLQQDTTLDQIRYILPLTRNRIERIGITRFGDTIMAGLQALNRAEREIDNMENP